MPNILNYKASIGCVNGLVSYEKPNGVIIKVESSTIQIPVKGGGRIITTGIVEKGERNFLSSILKYKKTTSSSANNVIGVIRKFLNPNIKDYDIHLNCLGNLLVNDPSIEVAMAISIYSSIIQKSVNNKIIVTGELSTKGKIKPVKNILYKIDAASRAGFSKVLIPKYNYENHFKRFKIEIVPVGNICEVVQLLM